MKKIKKVLTIWIVILMLMQTILPTISQAIDTVKLNINFERPYNDDNGDSVVGNDVYTLVRQAIQTIFKIGEQDGNGNLSFNNAYYCLRGGLGFGSTEEIVSSGVDYTKIADLSNKEAVISYFRDKIKYNIPETNYNAICWIAENMYLPKSQYAEEMKQDLLEAAGIEGPQLTDDDIEVIQQIAIWYFTNYDENGGQNSVSLADSVSLENLLQINNTQPDNDTTVSYNKNRATQINTLYRYFIDNSKSSNQVSTEKIPAKFELDKTLEPTIESKTVTGTRINAFVVGPFKIKETQKGNLKYEISYKMKYKIDSAEDWSELEIDNEMGTVYLSDANGTELDRTKNIEDMIGGEQFYITILKDVLDIDDIREFSFDIKYDSYYYKTIAEMLVASEEDQPVLKVDKEKISNPDEDNITIKPDDRVFDLALRKFITATNGTEITSRIPQISLKDLREGTSTEAKFEHPKDAIHLKKGDKIVYTIRVYNQADLNGYATEITDYLSDGLEFVQDSEINQKYGWTVAADGKTITTKYLENTLIKAYDKTMTEGLIDRDTNWQKAEDGTDGLYYADVQIECRIKDTAAYGTTIPNVAEISEDKAVDENNNELDVEDRDSIPENLTEEEIKNYEENPWKEDDDDYERVIVDDDRVFDLALRKFITATNGTEITSRIPQISLKDLREGTSTEAKFEHPKDAIHLKKGDKIVYTIRVYNQADLNGYASEITDYLSDGLEFVQNSETNQKYGWTVAADGKTITTKYLENTLIKAYDKTVTENTANANNGATGNNTASNSSNWQKAEDGTDGLYYADVQIECRIKDAAAYGTTIPNVAEISEDKAVDENNNELDVEDRDSTPENLTEEEIKNYEENPWKEDDDDYERVIVDPEEVIEPEKIFDLALRKFITATNGTEITSRIPKMSLSNLRNGTGTNAVFSHPKDAIHLKRGDKIIYTIRVYNQADLNGYASEITDYLSDGLEFVQDSEINQKYGWTVAADGKTITTRYLENTLIKAYDKTMTEGLIDRDTNWQKAEDGTDGLYYADVQIECRIKDTAAYGTTIPNVAEISEDKAVDENNNELDVEDRDSTPKDLTEEDIKNYEENPWKEDDDDYERVIVDDDRVFDLSLRKYISNIERKGQKVEFASRVPEIDTTTLKTNKTTAQYKHPKDILTVKQGDIITYKLRIYNEGELDGYATEITDYLPAGLGLLNGYTGNSNWLIESGNVENRPLVGENGIYKTQENVPTNGIFKDEDISKITVVSAKEGQLKIKDYLSLKNEMIKKYGSEVQEGDLYQVSTNDKNDGLFYKEIEVTCIVLAPNTYEGTLVNIAEISEDKAVDENKKELDIEDRDSKPNNVDLNNYELREENSTYQEDDDDYEPVELKYFDLALRKFITGVNETEVNTRIPEFYIDDEGNYKYKHDKTPVEVVDKDHVTYTIRVFNEGTIEGFAEEIEDDIPEGLIFLPEDSTNKEYRWKMYYKDDEGNLVETDKVEEATVIRTDYLSEANGSIDEETGKNSNLIEAFNKDTMNAPKYKDVKVVFQVSQKDIGEENAIVMNKAHITKDSDDDEDSTPDDWKPDDDDQDVEYIKVQKFDLALFKWVSKTIVTVNGKTTTTETGFKPNVGKTEQEGSDYRDNNVQEPIAAVTIDEKKINSTVVKFVYNIKVVNEGDIEGYVAEITDYIPEGLKFVAEDNPLWSQSEEGKITTRALETKLLKPGESAEIPVTFTWINNANNLGLKKNIAAITEDYNDKNVPDEDSTPKNEDVPNYDKEQEDDDDFALVILTLKTGREATYIGLVLVVIAIITAGTVLIKKYVLQ